MQKGQRVQLHPATNEWMQGDRYGAITGRGRRREYTDREGNITMERPYMVNLDKSGKTKRFHPENIFEVF